MPTKSGSARHATAADSTEAVDGFMSRLEHPHKSLVETLRKAILAVDSSVAEGIKWNAPSFRTTEYFATTNLRARAGIGLILHLGAKVRDLPDAGLAIDDPAGLLTWLGKDRAAIEFRDVDDLSAKKVALQAILRQWITRV